MAWHRCKTGRFGIHPIPDIPRHPISVYKVTGMLLHLEGAGRAIGIWSIEPKGEGTRYAAVARHWSEEAVKCHAETGFDESWGACADQLQGLCEST